MLRKVLAGHVSPETAVVVEDYPYGSLRCKKRYWLETATKGAGKGQTRLMEQTTNPKKPGEVWNKPHPSVYYAFLLLYQVEDAGSKEDGHIKHDGLMQYFRPHQLHRIKCAYYAGMNGDQRDELDRLEIQERRNDPKSWQEWDALTPEQKEAASY